MMSANRWIYTEDLGREQFYIAEVAGQIKFVWLDKYGIANIFSDMENLATYLVGELEECKRVCVEPYDTGIEGVDFLDDYFGIDDVDDLLEVDRIVRLCSDLEVNNG